MTSGKGLQTMTTAYLEAVDFTDGPGCEFSIEAVKKATADVTLFLTQAWPVIGERYKQAGHDLWLTRNGHGAGFWETGRGWTPQEGEQLTALAERYGPSDAYTGDDGRTYLI